MPNPNDPLGLLSDDPLGILTDDVAPPPVVPIHVRKRIAAPPLANAPLSPEAWQTQFDQLKAQGGLGALAEQDAIDATPLAASPAPMPDTAGGRIAEGFGGVGHGLLGALHRTTQAIRAPFYTQNVDPVTGAPVDLPYTEDAGGFAGWFGSGSPTPSVRRVDDPVGAHYGDLAAEQEAMVAAMSPAARIAGEGAQFVGQTAPALNPVLGGTIGAGTALLENKSDVGVGVNAALGGLAAPSGRIAGGIAGLFGGLTNRATRAGLPTLGKALSVGTAPVVADTLAMGGIGGAMGAGTAAETSLLEDNPELAQQEWDATLGTSGSMAGLGGLTSLLTRGRGAMRPGQRAFDLRSPAETAPAEVPIAEPVPAGVDSYLPPDVVARMKNQPVQRNLLNEGSPVDLQSLESPQTQGALLNPLDRQTGGMGPDRPGYSPTVIAEGGPVDPFTMQAKPRIDPFPANEAAPADPTAALGREVADIQGREQARQNAPIEDPLGILGEEVAANQQAAVRARDIAPEAADTNPAGMAPIVTASGTPRQRPMDLKPSDAILTRERRAGEVDPDQQTQEISPDIVAELNRRADQADRAQYGKQIERLAQRVKGETPEWKAQREEWGAQAKRDTSPEGRAAAAADDAEIRARGGRPSETATGLDTVPEHDGGAQNLFDSEAAPAPIASWFNDLADADRIRTPAARQPVDIRPEPRTATEPGVAPVVPGRAKNPVEDFINTMPEGDRAEARAAAKGWDGKSDPQGMIGNIKMAVYGPRERAAKKAARLAAQEKANAPSRPAPEKASEVPAGEVPRAAEPAPGVEPVGRGTEGSPAVRSGDAGETRPGNRPDVERADPVRTELDRKQPPAPETDAGAGGSNLSRRGATVDPIDEAAKLVGRGVKKVGPLIKSAANEAAILASPVKLGKQVVDWYQKPLIDRVASGGGEVGQEFAKRARETNDRARTLEGQLAPLRRTAAETVGTSRDGRIAGRSLTNIEWDGEFGRARSHLVAEGQIDPTPLEAKWQKAHQELFYASGKQAEDAGLMQRQSNGKEVPFRADKNRKEAIRAPEAELRWLVAHPADPNSQKLMAHVAEKNGMKTEELQSLMEAAFGERSLERPAALEQARGLKYFPTHMRGEGGRIIPLLKSNPLTMVQDLATRTPMRTAFHEKFGNETPSKGVEEYVKAGGEREHAEDLFRALNGMPLDNPGSGPRPGSGLDIFARRLGAAIGMLRSAKLSLSAAVNAPESFAKTLPMAGVTPYVRALRKLFRHPADAATEMENMGAMALHEFNWHLEPGKRLEQVERVVRDVLGMPLHVIEQKNVTLATLAGAVKAADLKAGRGTMFDRVRLNWLGFKPDEITALMDGTAKPEQYQAVISRFPEWTQGHASKPSEGSRAGGSKWWNTLMIADRFPRMTMARFMRAANSIPELWKQGEKGQAAAAAALLTGMGLGHTVAGGAGLLIRASLVGALGAYGSKLLTGEDKVSAWKDFLLSSLSSSLFGPAATAVGSTTSALTGVGTDPNTSPSQLVTGAMLPVSAAEDAINLTRAIMGETGLPGSRYKDLYPADAGLKFLESNVPLMKAAVNVAGAMGVGTRDLPMEAAMTSYWDWRRRYAPFEGASAPTEFSEFRTASKKAARMVQNGQDPTEFLEKALSAKITGGVAREKAFTALSTSLMSRRVLDDLKPEQKKAAADYLGAATFDRISTYDRLLEAWSQRLKDAR
jgi:hypothetical protein